jgi:predicted RNase H-like HicB family nuclease
LTDATRYPAHVFWSDEDEGYIAVAPDLPGCSAFGETQQCALIELQSAIAAWIKAANAAANPIPKPTRPAVVDNYSGKILARMPKSLHAQIAKQARNEDVSLNQYIVFLLTSAITQQQVVRYGVSGVCDTKLFSAWAKFPWEQKISDKFLLVYDFKEVSPVENIQWQLASKGLMLTRLMEK